MNNGQPIRVQIISSNHIMRTGLHTVLELHSNFLIVGEIFAARHAADVAGKEQPHVVLIDLDLSGIDVLSLVQDLQKTTEDALLILLSSLSDGYLVREALRLGAGGVVLKVQPPAVLIAAIESLCIERLQQERQKVRPRTILLDGLPIEKKTGLETVKKNGLTSREQEIVGLIGKGLRNKSIADRLCISETTVRHHLTTIFNKLNVSDRQQLLIWAHRHRLVDLTQGSNLTISLKEPINS